MSIFMKGLIVGLAYVAPIGMQNMYLINTSIKRERLRAFQVALIIIFFDISLALACFFGVGMLLEHIALLRFIFMGVGSLAVMYIGYSLMKSKPKMTEEGDFYSSILKVMLTCFAVTWLNPQAIIDGSLLLGGIRTTLSSEEGTLFIIGVTFASFLWFSTIALGVSSFRRFFSTKVLKIINIVCGCILIYFGFMLFVDFIKLIIGG